MERSWLKLSEREGMVSGRVIKNDGARAERGAEVMEQVWSGLNWPLEFHS